LAFTTEEDTVLVFSMDLSNMYSPLPTFRDAVAEATGLTRAQVMFSATHTHSAPHLSNDAEPSIGRYCAFLKDKLVQAGLLERGTVSHDRRKIALRCTGKAQPIIAAGLEMQQRFFARITADIPAADWAVYRRITETIRKNTLSLMTNTKGVVQYEGE
jgi:hypothetical protein